MTHAISPKRHSLSLRRTLNDTECYFGAGQGERA
jgi:hypothetical protein